MHLTPAPDSPLRVREEHTPPHQRLSQARSTPTPTPRVRWVKRCVRWQRISPLLVPGRPGTFCSPAWAAPCFRSQVRALSLGPCLPADTVRQSSPGRFRQRELHDRLPGPRLLRHGEALPCSPRKRGRSRGVPVPHGWPEYRQLYPCLPSLSAPRFSLTCEMESHAFDVLRVKLSVHAPRRHIRHLIIPLPPERGCGEGDGGRTAAHRGPHGSG